MAYSSPSKQLQPATYGGHSKLNDPNILTATYQSRCLSTVQRSSIIIAVCGLNDNGNNASSVKDGWFFSDFYLMHHLFRDTASTQYWLTCVSPEAYVQKNTELLHGDQDRQGKIVLDASMLEENRDIITVSDKDLPERFLSYISDASKSTQDTDRQILIVMFGHGWENVFSIIIGGSGAQGGVFGEAVSPETLHQALKRHNPNPQAIVLSDSYFGGGWCYARSGNISNIHGVVEDSELSSWPNSAFVRQALGSMFAISIAEALVRSELVGESEINPMGTPAFTTLVETIRDILVKEVDGSSAPVEALSFAAQDDLWARIPVPNQASLSPRSQIVMKP